MFDDVTILGKHAHVLRSHPLRFDLHCQSWILSVSFTIKLVCFITEQSHLRFAIPCTRQIMSLTNLTPGSRTISSRIQTILTRALQFLNASPSATLQRQCYWLAPTTLACFAYCCWRTQYQTRAAWFKAFERRVGPISRVWLTRHRSQRETLLFESIWR